MIYDGRLFMSKKQSFFLSPLVNHFSKVALLAISLSSLVITANAAERPKPQVNVATAQLRSLAPVAWVSGTVVSQNNAKIAAEVSGRLIEMAKIGAEVQKGDVIAQINPETLKILLTENQASVESAEFKLKFLEEEVVRKRGLAARKLSAINDLDETISNRDVSIGDLAEARAKLAQTAVQLSYTRIKAPFNGMVTKRLSNIGEFINSGTAIIQLVETKNLEAVAAAALTSYPFLKTSTKLAVKSPLGTGIAPIKTLVPVAEVRSHLMEVRLDMSDFDWPVGLDIRIAIPNGERKQVIAVPRDALVLRREGISIFKIDDGNKALQISVTSGMGAGEFIQVIGDIHEGERVVIRGAERLRNGQEVVIKTNNPSLISGNQ